jgi:hypothetical protein
MPANEANPPTASHGQTNLDRRMEALLGDSLPKHLGSGWWSGVFGVLLGLGSFLTVLVFRYPHWLTASETAPRYPIETMRAILALAIVASFLLSALNILLRPSKRLGHLQCDVTSLGLQTPLVVAGPRIATRLPAAPSTGRGRRCVGLHERQLAAEIQACAPRVPESTQAIPWRRSWLARRSTSSSNSYT